MNPAEVFVKRYYAEGNKLVLDGEPVELEKALAALPKLKAEHPGCALPPMLWERSA